MEQKNKKILAIIIIALIVIAFIFVALSAISKKKARTTSKTTPAVVETKIVEQKNEEKDSVPLTEEKKAEIAAIRNIKGKITKIEANAIEIVPTEGDKLTLKVPQEGANFMSQAKREDGAFIVKEIGLSNIPKNKEVEIQYNSSNNEVMMVVVK